jgi:outer membrane lipoprotein-sorting protein
MARNSKTLFLTLCTVVVPFSVAQSGEVDDLIEKNIAARGGREAWQAVQSITIKGQYTAFSKVSPYTLNRKRDRQIRFESAWSGKPILMAYDGETAWTSNEFMEMGWHQRMGAQDFIAFRQEFDFANPFFDYKEHGHKVELLGPGEVDGVQGNAVKLTRSDGQEETWYFDPVSGLEVARESVGSDFGSPNPQRTFFEDYREIGGVVIPYFTETQWYTRDRIFEVEEVEINPELDDSIFAFPLPPGMDRLATLAGEWNVKSEVRQSPRAPWTETEHQTTVQSLARGALLQEAYVDKEGTQIVWSLSYDQFREAYRLTYLDDFTSYLDIQGGNFDEDGNLVLDDVESGSTWAAFGQTFHTRTRLADVEPDSFRIEEETSTNGGENWRLLGRRTYTRVEE